MLVLSRKHSESVILKRNGVIIGTITVVKFSGDRTVRLGFEFPEDIVILREEVAETESGPMMADPDPEESPADSDSDEL